MKVKVFRILGVMALILAMGSLSACFDEHYYPGYPRYSYGSPGYAYPGYHPQYAPGHVPGPRYYASNPHPYWRGRQRWEHEEHAEHERNEHHHDRD